MGLLAALGFLTVLPVPAAASATPERVGRSQLYFPVVGLLLGLALTGLHWLLTSYLPPLLAAALLLAVWELLTGGLHTDGLMDTCDGLFGGRTPQERLVIMQDARVGAFGVLGAVLVLLVKYGALASLPVSAAGALAVALTAGRWAMVAAIGWFPYARPAGAGAAFKDASRPWMAWLGLALALAVGWGFGRTLGLVAVAGAVPVVWALGRFAARRLGGLTGDLYGAGAHLVEAGILAVAASGPWR
ncbi:MAG: adenosylcobinamide-GDP ribazoletransferase [Dehalococcoidia bacterium]|nr:adenosylcobinamide-GDP ribazoletransferase [Dehalococcoidia bacterium]